VADCIHSVKVKTGDVMFLPSGRIHAIGAGNVIFEIQQNSDTTYRVFDWNRVGLDGKPRELHLAQSLASIDFEDFEPSLVATDFSGTGPVRRRLLVNDPLFSVEAIELAGEEVLPVKSGKAQIFAVLTGEIRVGHERMTMDLAPGQFCLAPAVLEGTTIRAKDASRFLRIEPGTI